MGELYRSVALSHLHGDDLAAMARLGLRTVFDLRTESERSAAPDVLPPGAEPVVCDVLADEKRAAPAVLFQTLEDPAAAQEMLGGGKAAALFEMGYREIVGLPSALSSYRTFFETRRAGRAPAGALPLHHGQGPDRLGGRLDPAVPRGLEGGRPQRLPADEPRPAARAAAGLRALPRRRRRPSPARPGARRRRGLPEGRARRDGHAVRVDRGLLHRRAPHRRGDAAEAQGGPHRAGRVDGGCRARPATSQRRRSGGVHAEARRHRRRASAFPLWRRAHDQALAASQTVPCRAACFGLERAAPPTTSSVRPSPSRARRSSGSALSCGMSLPACAWIWLHRALRSR